MQRTRILIEDSQHAAYMAEKAALYAEWQAMRQRWATEDAADARVMSTWRIGWIISVMLIAAMWMAAAIVPQYAPLFATVAVLFAFVAWVAIMVWAIQQLR